MEFYNIIKEEESKQYYIELNKFLTKEYNKKKIYPALEDLFNSFKYTPYDKVKVVILGQDPYHGEGQAMGLSFSVNDGIKIPPSLSNIYKEIALEYGYDDIPDNGNLTKWARQGVLLLNSVLTVEEGRPGSHKDKGWETFTDNIIKLLNEKDTPIIFMLWGNYAITKSRYITNSKHLVLTSPHPSPFSARKGFFGCNHFKEANKFLKENNIEEIDWKIDDINLTII